MNIPNPQPKLEERLRGVMRLKQYSKRTEEGYVQWYKRDDSALPTGLTPDWAA